jgi:class 3 adenylate cyclase
MEPSTGPATIVMTDLAGSTALRSHLGEEAADELRREHGVEAARVEATAETGHILAAEIVRVLARGQAGAECPIRSRRRSARG